MDIFIYRTFNEWYKDAPSETLEGTISASYNGSVVVETTIDYREYRQRLSLKNNFAMIYKMSYGFLACAKEINIYSTFDSWEKSKPEIAFKGEVCEDECSDSQFVFMTEDGFKHYISLDGIYATTYER